MFLQEQKQTENQDIFPSNVQVQHITQQNENYTQINCDQSELNYKQEINYQNNEYSMQNVKLPLTMVGSVALSKGMYLTLMKRREQKAFGNTSYFCTPRPRTTDNKIQIGKQYSSCARINTTHKFNNTQTQHNFNVRKSYKEIHRTKKIKKENYKESISQRKSLLKGSQSCEDNILTEITYSCNNRNNKNNNGKKRNSKQNNDNMSKCLNEKQNDNYKGFNIQQKIKKDKQNKQGEQTNNKQQISLMRKRSKQYQNENNKINLSQKSQVSQIKISKRARKFDGVNNNEQIGKNQGRYEDSDDKENNISSINNSKPYGEKNSSKHTIKIISEMQEQKYSYIWHQESQDLRIESQMFIKQTKQGNSQFTKKCVPGYRVKFVTSKNKIYAFNCFREKDLQIEKQFHNTVDQDLDNDCDTDCEQIKDSIGNVFQSLCIAVCEEKINAQYQRQNYYKNYNQF